MKVKFWYKSAYYMTVCVISGIGLVVMPCATAILCNSTELGLGMALLSLTAFLIATYISARVPCSYTVCEDRVKFNIHWKKLEIPLDEIVSMEVTQEFIDTLMLRERPYFLEHLTIKTRSLGELKFTQKTYSPPVTAGFDMVLTDGKFDKLKKEVMARKK